MKKTTYFLVYAATLVIGVLLLIFSQEPLTSVVPTALRGVMVTIGIVSTAAGVICLLLSMRRKRDADGVPASRPWYMTAMSICAIFWGILLICMPATFTGILPITLGVTLIIAGLAQGMWIIGASRPYGASGWWYVVPFCVIGAGIVDITLVNDYSNMAQSGSTACVLSGILLLCYGVNGFISLNRRKRIEKEVADSVNEINGKDKGSAA